ncbi:hypothetical protein, partial [Mycobacterium tuberculosis]|uniref:hypothetical protein n=1 Tax=Mycobacterium tuberculosis TaxID=1773 RepID=UPI0011153487
MIEGVITFSDDQRNYHVFTDIEIKQGVKFITLEKSYVLSLSDIDGVIILNYEVLNFHTLSAQLKVVPLLISLFSGNKLSFEGGAYIHMSPQKDTLAELLEWYDCLLELEKTFELLGIEKTTVIEQKQDRQLGLELEWLI